MADGTLLVWDAPNMDMTLGNLLGTRPTPAQRPRFDAVGRWLLEQAKDADQVEATIFTNIAPGSAPYVRGWVEAVRSFGYAVFAKPKAGPDDDIDDEMREHIEQRHAAGELHTVVVASGDGRNFKDLLEDLAGDGVAVRVLGFEEFATYAITSEVIDFVDGEDVPGAFPNALPRLRLDKLPAEGLWLPPSRPLSALQEA
jgi:putative heme uptake system protein